MYLCSTYDKRDQEHVQLKCDECGSEYLGIFSTAKRHIILRNKHSCRICVSRRAGKKTAKKCQKYIQSGILAMEIQLKEKM